MSADNGVYILKTINPKGGYEFRVAHLQAVDNVGWDDNLRRMTDDPIVQIHNAHEMWGHSHVWDTREDAFRIAEKILEDLDVCEYGIQILTIQAQWDQSLELCGSLQLLRPSSRPWAWVLYCPCSSG